MELVFLFLVQKAAQLFLKAALLVVLHVLLLTATGVR